MHLRRLLTKYMQKKNHRLKCNSVIIKDKFVNFHILLENIRNHQ